MEPLFENTTVRTEKIDREFCRYVKDPNNYTVPVLTVLVSLGFLIYSITLAARKEPGVIWLVGLLAVIFLFSVWYLFRVDSRLYLRERKELKKNFGTADLENRVSFFETEYHLTCAQTRADVTVRYSDIAKITRTPSLLLLTRYNKATTILARAGFCGQQEEDVLAFLQDACAGAAYKDRCK
ncbi:MAG: hypothetical protein MJ085_01455 [Clostridia bacterium]|nr:hypothetical protein [Clostridia bacterium]